MHETVAGALDKVVAFVRAQAGAYCADCVRARLSLGRAMTSLKLLKAAAAPEVQLLQEPGTCVCCRRSRKVLRTVA